MSNAVKSLSAPLAQCVKHRSSNQTLTGSNLAEYPLYIFFFFFFVIIISLFSFFVRFYSSFFYGVYLAVRSKKLFSTGDNW